MKRELLLILGIFFGICVAVSNANPPEQVQIREQRTTQELIRRTEVGRDRYDSWVQRSRNGYQGNGGGNGYYRRGLFGRRR